MSSASERLKLFIDGRKILDGGIGSFVETLIDGLIHSSPIIICVLLPSDIWEIRRDLKERWLANEKLKFLFDDTPKYSLRELFLLPLKLRAELKEWTYFLSPHYTLPFFVPCKTVVVVHDLIQLNGKGNFLFKVIHWTLIRSAILRASAIVTVSECSKHAILERFGSWYRGQLYVVPNAIRLGQEVSDRHSEYIGNKFKTAAKNSTSAKEKKMERLLFLSADRDHKRLDLFLEFLLLCKENGIKFKANVVTRLRPRSKMLIEQLGLEDEINLYRDIKEETLIELYQSSTCLVFPSEVEGFGIPCVEAMYHGLKVVCSRIPVLEEIVGESGWYFTPGSAKSLYEVFLESSDATEAELSRRIVLGKQKVSRNYSRDVQARNFLEVLSTL